MLMADMCFVMSGASHYSPVNSHSIHGGPGLLSVTAITLRRCHRSVAISCWFLIIFVNASAGTFGGAQELGVEAMGPFTPYFAKAHGNSRDVIAHLDVLVRPQLASEKGSPERQCCHLSCDVTNISLTLYSAKLSAAKQSVS
jgi:hypothetical protein